MDNTLPRFCEWECRKCVHCGRPYKGGNIRKCVSDKAPTSLDHLDIYGKKAKECPHFLGANGETIKAFNCSCPGSSANGVDVTVCGCELESHPRCTLFDRGDLSDPTVVRCRDCLDNPNRK